MTGKSPPNGRIRFGVFEADLESGELFKEGQRIALANQSFVALAALLERPGQLVSREELRRRLWPDNRVVEFDQGLNAIINRLREALGSAPDGARLIETLPRRGYRFVGTLQNEPAHEPARAGEPRHRIVAYTLVAALCTVVALVAVVLLTRRGPAESSNLRIIPLTTLTGQEVAPQFMPKGDELLFAWNGDTDAAGRFDLYSKRADSERLLRITHDPATALHAAWAPDGDQIALARQTDSDGGIYLIPKSGAPARRLAPANFMNEPYMQVSWSPDGRRIAYAAIEPDGWSHIRFIDLASGATRPLPDKPPTCTDAGIPAFSPDGKWLAFVCTSSVAVYNVYVVELASGMTRSLLSLQGNAQGLAWLTTSDALVVANESDIDSGIWRVTLGGRASRLVRSEGPIGPGITVSARGIVFVRENHVVDIWRADLTAPNTASHNLVSSTRTQLVPAYSPDGTHIAFQSSRSGAAEIWLADGDGRNPVKLTAFNGPLTGAPSWCHDGRRIAFDSRASGSSALYVLDIFEGHPQRLDTTQPNLALPTWSADCRWIIASNGRTALYRVPVSGGAVELFTTKRAYRAVIAGSNVIFNVSGDKGVELWSKPVEGGAETPLPGMVPLRYSDSWTATARGVYFTSVSSGHAPVVSLYDFVSHQTHAVRTLEGIPADLGGLGITVSSDERWLLYTRSERSDGDIMLARPDSVP